MSLCVSEINASAYRYYDAVLPQFNEICSPLFKLGMKNFAYFKLYKNGRYLHLSNNKKFIQTYTETIKDMGDFFSDCHTNTLTMGQKYFCLNGDINSFDRKKDSILHLAHNFSFWNILNIFKTNGTDYNECYSFSLGLEGDFPTPFYLNNLPLLEQFTTYFNEKAEDIIDCSHKDKLSAFEKQYHFNKRSEDDIFAKKIEAFLQEIEINRSSLRINEQQSGECFPHLEKTISPRQLECAQLIAKGLSSKEVARALNLSPRTVDEYINILKQKFNAKNRPQLLYSLNRQL